jgi:LCP family protein required for cell wall assembly
MSDDWPQGWYQNDKPSGYGSGGAGGMASDPTQNMRTQAPGRVPGAAPSAWPSQPPPRSSAGGYGGGSAGGGGSYGPGRTYRLSPGWRRWLRPKRLLILFAALIVVLAALGFFFYTSINGKLNRANVLTDYSGRPAPTVGTNWLITGSDSRGGLTRAQEAQLALGHDVSGGRSDTIMVLHIPANGNPPVLVSIPRDSYVDIPGYGWNKINAAYAVGGPKLLAQTVQNVTGLYINHYLGIGLGGLVDAVNAVGGVHMCLPTAMKDKLAGLNLPKGCQNLSGEQVLAFVRTRHFPLGDLQREQDQRLLLSALLKKMTSPGTMLNPFASIPAAYSVAGTLDVDSSVQLLDLYSVGQALKSPESTSVPFGNFENTSVGSVIRWDHTKASELFNDLAADKPVPKSLLSSTAFQGTA